MATQQKFTEKAQEAIVTGQRATEARRLSQFEPEALLLGLLEQSDGVVPQTLLRMGVDPAKASRETTALLDAAPKLQYSSEPVVSSSLRKALQAAEGEARQFGDEYVSTEHLLLGIMSVADSPAARLLARLGVTKDGVYQALESIRGGQRVTDPNPEGKYQALEKYGRDLTEAARDGKLDPVIGRDEEAFSLVSTRMWRALYSTGMFAT